MPRLEVTVELNDGNKFVFTTSTYAALSDRVAMERRYQISFTEYQKQVRAGTAREEVAAFLTWRAANRYKDQGAFDDWTEQVADFDLVDLDAPPPEEDEKKEDGATVTPLNGQVVDPTEAVSTPQ